MKRERILKSPLAHVLIVVLILSSLAIFASFSAVSDPPYNMHLSWDQNDTAHTMVISWQTNRSIESIVYYDIAPRCGNPASYAYSATGSAHIWPQIGEAFGYVHDVLLTGLSTDTTYYYICGSSSGGYSAERGFHTAPVGSSSFFFVAGGDSRTNEVPRRAISKAMAQKSPRFILHMGDYMVRDSPSDYMEWLDDVNHNWITPENLRIPMLGCIGNHEGSGRCITSQYAWPPGSAENERWYSLDYGDLHIICLSNSYDTVSSQTAWLQSDLEAAKDKPWKFAFFHEPPYTSGGHIPKTDVQQQWCPLFEQYGVNIVFAGHTHNYERSYPIKGSPNAYRVSDPANGTTYLVTGGWGAPLSGVEYGWWTAKCDSRYHYCLVEIQGTTRLICTEYNENNIAYDSFQITRD